jgi:HAD superfamily hydrolase (TIGR01509 family)
MPTKRIIQPLQGYKLAAVVFDLDGTLCYYAVSIEEAMGIALDRLGKRAALIGDLSVAAARYVELWYELQDDHDNIKSLRDRIWVNLLLEHGLDDEGFALSLSEVYARIRKASLTLYAEARCLLRDLRAKYKVGLLTNGLRDLQWEKIELLGIRSFFDAVVVSGDVGIHKPDVRLFEKLLRELNTSADKAIYVGNSFHIDIIGAHEAGMWSVWVNPDGEQEPEESVADVTISNLGALRRILL